MSSSIRFKLFLSCFALIAGIVIAVGLAAGGNPVNRIALELGLCLLGAIVMTWIFSTAIEWRIRRLKIFIEHVLDASNIDAPLPEESEEVELLNQSLRRMASRIRELVDRLSLDPSARRHSEEHGGRRAGSGSPDARDVLQSGTVRSAGLKHPVEENVPLVGLVRDPNFLSLISGVLASGEPVKRQAPVCRGRCVGFRGVCGAALGPAAPRRAGDPARYHGS